MVFRLTVLVDWGGDRGDMEIPDVGWCLGSLWGPSFSAVFSKEFLAKNSSVAPQLAAYKLR